MNDSSISSFHFLIMPFFWQIYVESIKKHPTFYNQSNNCFHFLLFS